ncbi:radical SAM protein [Limibaculum sp. M0105]|uniref:Radical SAM protein n=1 Tax=Thermohalobaculum xanthum TaxID=2753746 RepID=A0A8J7M9T8_9RHOB|nr:radical SAM protein [Thermohalobaculum xanthum]MBK0400885.1 radical SAM protein [Thermohalobaculum xanthum]
MNRKMQNSHLAPHRQTPMAIAEMLDASGAAQTRLFDEAREVRDTYFGRSAVVRGVIEITDVCVKSCLYCPMRVENRYKRYSQNAGDVLEAAESVYQAGVGVVALQGGETPASTRLSLRLIPKIREVFAGNVEVLLCLGNKDRVELKELKQAGADSYILKQETSDPELHLEMCGEDLDTRVACAKDLIDLGFRTGVGAIVGLPGQSRASLVRDAILPGELGAQMMSASPFIPAANSPLAGSPMGDLNLTLNLMAVMRLLNPRALIPAVSALEKPQSGGQALGFKAGANVITINFTPERDRSKYAIYGADRFVVRREHALATLEKAGIEPLFGREAFAFWHRPANLNVGAL